MCDITVSYVQSKELGRPILSKDYLHMLTLNIPLQLTSAFEQKFPFDELASDSGRFLFIEMCKGISIRYPPRSSSQNDCKMKQTAQSAQESTSSTKLVRVLRKRKTGFNFVFQQTPALGTHGHVHPFSWVRWVDNGRISAFLSGQRKQRCLYVIISTLTCFFVFSFLLMSFKHA